MNFRGYNYSERSMDNLMEDDSTYQIVGVIDVSRSMCL